MSTVAPGLNATAKPRCECGGTCACGGQCNGPDQAAVTACEASGCECGCGGGRAAAVARSAIRRARAETVPHPKEPKTQQPSREEAPRQRRSLPAQHTPTLLSAFHPDALHPDTIKAINEHWDSAELGLQNVHCASCVGAIERLPRSLPGLVEARVNLRDRSARVVWERDRLTLADVAAALDRLGFPPSPKRQSRARNDRQRENREQLVRLAVAGAIATNVMLMALALYAGAEGGAFSAYASLFRWLSAILTGLSLAWPGRVFFASSWRAMRAGRLNLDAPIALAMLVGGVAGLINTLRGTGEIYFDSVAALVFLLLIGRWLQGRQQRWAIDAVEMLLTLTPRTARRVEADPGGGGGGHEVIREVATDRLAPLDLVEVRAGEAIPADGEIAIGRSHVDESILTGESRPIAVEPGRSVAAGSTNLESVIRVRVRVAGQETRVAKLMAMLADAAERKAPTIRWADTLSGYFITGMLALSMVTLIVWWRIDPARAVENAASLLIVTCPCALGLAMPLVMTLAIGRAAQRQILIKGADALEALATPATLLLDKTGTLTQNALRVLRWTGDTSLQPLVAQIEANSTHPIARAIVDAYGTVSSIAIPGTLKEVSQTTGSGIEALASIDKVDRRVLIGSRAFATQRGVTIPSAIDKALDQAAHEGATPVVVAIDNTAQAAIALGDPPREDATSAIADLRDRGWHVGVLSGDDSRVVHSLATRLSIPTDDAHGGISPEAKLAAVQNRLHSGSVVMVGDGVNDAAALAAASVGIAVHGGSEASLTAADIYLARPGLSPIVELLDAARATRRAMRRCMIASVAYNAVSGTLAVCGLISPLIAALLMPASSLTVLAIAVLSRTFPRQPASPAPVVPSQGAR